MKYLNYLSRFIFAASFFILNVQYSIAQDNSTKKENAKKIAFKNMVDSQHFNFSAQSVYPLRGSYRNLNSPYNVIISKDSMVSNLPYFGHVFSAPYSPTQPALDFTSTDFTYKVSPHKKGGWNILVKPNDKRDIQQYDFIVYDNGNATLSVISNSRDAITYNGYITGKE